MPPSALSTLRIGVGKLDSPAKSRCLSVTATPKSKRDRALVLPDNIIWARRTKEAGGKGTNTCFRPEGPEKRASPRPARRSLWDRMHGSNSCLLSNPLSLASISRPIARVTLGTALASLRRRRPQWGRCPTVVVRIPASRDPDRGALRSDSTKNRNGIGPCQ